MVEAVRAGRIPLAGRADGAVRAGRPPHPGGHGLRARAEELGFAAVWQADSRLVREATVPMAAFAATTERIAVGSGVIDVWTRNPARLASLFSTLDDLAPAASWRAWGRGGTRWPPRSASPGSRPLRVMREVVESLRALLRCDGPVTYDGDYVHLDGVELDYVHQERRAKHVPIYIGATGMRMMELAGEIADGAVLNYLVSPGYNRRALAALADGCGPGRTHAGRRRPPPAGGVLARRRPEAALDAARLLVTQYLGQQPHIMAASGVPSSLLDDIAAVLTWPAGHDEVVAASKLVPDEVVQMLCAAGTAAECRAKVAEYVAAGCTSPILYPLGDVAATLEAFAPADADGGAVRLAEGSLVVLVGPPASGKSTWAAEQFPADQVVSSDGLRAVVGTGEHDQRASQGRVRRARPGGRAAAAAPPDHRGRHAGHRRQAAPALAGGGRPGGRAVRGRGVRRGRRPCRARNRARERPCPAKVLSSMLAAWPGVRDALAGEGVRRRPPARPGHVVAPDLVAAPRPPPARRRARWRSSSACSSPASAGPAARPRPAPGWPRWPWPPRRRASPASG